VQIESVWRDSIVYYYECFHVGLLSFKSRVLLRFGGVALFRIREGYGVVERTNREAINQPNYRVCLHDSMPYNILGVEFRMCPRRITNLNDFVCMPIGYMPNL